MADHFPYQPPASTPPASPPPIRPGTGEPATIQVFAILHLVFGIIGVLMGVWTVLSIFFNEKLASFGGFEGPGGEAYAEAQRVYLGATSWVTIMTGVFMLMLAGLLIVSGVKLMKRRRAGLVWSNRYAWLSLATKIISIVLALLVVMPASREMLESLPAQMDGMESMMSISMTASVIAGPLFGMIYPILSLILLNQPKVTRHLEVDS